ncbi:MAG: type II toxin-antitoxin system mRNA interferase toxin, RelE/StbE family [Coxiellaceae bacterium]|nr:type II toxin-antitoxin system mRNA interferase toxin, RelE/StbE family [Coxiellaceae bacterium]
MEAKTVIISNSAKKDIKRIPTNIAVKLALWVETVEEIGLREVRKLKGYHDEPLKGKRKGQRSVRMNKAYRVIYTEHDQGIIELNFIEVLEVNKHDY